MAFLRRVSFRHSKLGKKRKKKQVWRKPTGRDNKMREERRGRPAAVKIGYKNKKLERGNLPVIRSLRDIKKLKKGDKVVLGNIGNKKKIEISKKLHEMKVEIQNLNVRKFLKHVEVKSKSKEDKVKTAGEKK